MNQQILKPTDAELEILQILWEKEKASVREVHNVIASTKNVGYTTTLKLMQIMFEKGIVSRDDRAKVHIYEPTIDKNATFNAIINRITNNLFKGDKTALVKQIISADSVSKENLEEIKTAIDSELENRSL